MQVLRFVRGRMFVILHDLFGVLAAVLVARVLTNGLDIGDRAGLAAALELAAVAVPVHGVVKPSVFT